MQIKRKASAHWQGTGKEGKGTLTSQSGVLSNTQYGFNSRFADGIGTNPEELIGAAHAGCYSMKLAFNLNASGLQPKASITDAIVILEDGCITEVQLTTRVKTEGLTKEKFEELAADAKANCPVSKLLKANITLTTVLV